MSKRLDRNTCRELRRKAKRWAREAEDGRDRRLAQRLAREFREQERRMGPETERARRNRAR